MAINGSSWMSVSFFFSRNCDRRAVASEVSGLSEEICRLQRFRWEQASQVSLWRVCHTFPNLHNQGDPYCAFFADDVLPGKTTLVLFICGIFPYSFAYLSLWRGLVRRQIKIKPGKFDLD
ncbi:hypothetical protein PoB_000965000 [Plakobranchus ocellatus]|uniref:Uncharacterized protein n=1 Tax=Plakobranchus ocellatus TaxID=259542 RepID=A0AAV3YK88_9GAST|nr:hypothetical protein PoB_000965000 [Plakobranchus ocellatus]